MIQLLKLSLALFLVLFLVSGCAQKVRIKALSPAEVGDMATKKTVAISTFKNDKYGLSGKIESQIAKHKLDKKRYFTLVSRKDLNRVIQEQKLQASELMDEATATRVGRLIGAQAIVNGEIASASAVSDRYFDNRVRCLKYVKDKGCVRFQYYQVSCKTVQASVSANINIVNVETSSVIYGDTISKEYSADSCKNGKILSKGQALNRLTSSIASEFVYKLTPHYVYFNVGLLDEIELDDVSDEQETIFENSLEYIEAGRMDKAQMLLQGLLDEVYSKSFVVSYVLGVVYEAQGEFNEAKEMYIMADDLTTKPIQEINLALVRIDSLIAKRQEAKEQMNAK